MTTYVKAANINKCKNCGSEEAFTWDNAIQNHSQVGHGQLTTNDTSCVFYLGCNICSETLAVVSADEITKLLNELL